jgi:hypothetical protein
MEAFIKYKRICETVTDNTIQKFFDDLITEGWEIIYYCEQPINAFEMRITVVCGKKQNKIL